MCQNCSISVLVDPGAGKKKVRTFGHPLGIIMTCKVDSVVSADSVNSAGGADSADKDSVDGANSAT